MTEGYNGRFCSFLMRTKTFRVVLRRPLLFCTSTRLYDPTFVSPWCQSKVQSMIHPNDISRSDPALSSSNPRIPRTLRSRSLICIEVLVCGAVQFGSADIVEESQRGRMGVRF
jgi:hypothetical protein